MFVGRVTGPELRKKNPGRSTFLGITENRGGLHMWSFLVIQASKLTEVQLV